MFRASAVLALGLVLTGCGTVSDYVLGVDNNEPPAELKSIESATGVQTVWERDVGSGGGRGAFGLTPTVLGDRVYAADGDGDVTAWSAETGDRIWSVDVELALSGGPGADQSLVVVGSENGEVVALEAADGTTRWETRVSSEVLAPPRVTDGLVLVRTVDGKLTALDSASGLVIWTYDRTVPVLTLRGTSAPAMSGGLAIGGFDGGRLVALDVSDGQTVWERRVAVPRGRTELERLVDIDSAPQIHEGTLYVATFQGRVAALDASSGETLWQRDMSSHAGLGVDDRHVFVTDERSHVWALDRSSSASLWRNSDLQFRAATAPRRVGDFVVVGDLEGYVHFLSIEDGRIAARVQVGSAPIYAPPLVRGDIVYVFNSDGSLAALRPGG